MSFSTPDATVKRGNGPLSDNEGEEGYWLSERDAQTAFYELNFGREYFIRRVSVEWVFPPKLFEVSFLTGSGQWTVIKKEAPSGMKTEMEFN